MTISPITIGLVVLTVLALTVLISFGMAGRQQEALKLEHKAVPPRWKIITAGLVTILAYMLAVVAAILMLVAPLANMQITSSVDSTTYLLIGLVIGLALVGTALYWLFVKLGLFSWKTFSMDD